MDPYDPYPEIREAVARVCARFDMSYWLQCEEEERLAIEFFEAMRADGWLGICMPEAYGGSGLGITAAATMLQTISEHGGGWTATGVVHGYVYGPHALVVHGTAEQKERLLVPLIKGEQRSCFAVTEPARARTRPTSRPARSGAATTTTSPARRSGRPACSTG